MPIRLRITLLFSLFAFIILGIVCGGIYYFSHQARLATIKTRLTNRGITTARLLSQQGIFDKEVIRRIDSLTTISLKNKTVQAYDYQSSKVYTYADVPGDTLAIGEGVLDNARVNKTHYFKIGDKEAVAYHFVNDAARIVIITAAEDVEGRKNLDDLAKILAVTFLLGFFLALLGGYLFSKSLLRPIKKISEDATEISAQNLARRIKTGTTKDEWYQLAATLNQLLDRLQESFELQRRFISNASHELSTPLTAISSQLQVSLQMERDATEYKRVMESVYQDVQHMSKLTQTLLQFAKASGDGGGLEIHLVRIDEVIMGVPAEMAKIDSRYIVKLEFEDLPDDETRLLVFGNEALLSTAIRNIVSNACKYSNDHLATVTLQTNGNQIFVSVTNKGIGIPPDKLRKIFQPFYRVEENTNAEGFGLGLSLTDRIIKLHKGTIAATSDPGGDTVFSIQLPSANGLQRE